MSKKTMFNTRFWEDNYISNLDPIEKLIFLYAITSHRISVCGIYEVPLKVMAMETGIDKEMLPKILGRFEKDKKIVYVKGWLCIVNYPKHQNYNKTTMVKAISNEIKQIPLEILDIFIGYGYPIDTLSLGYKVKEQVQDKVKDKVKVKEQVQDKVKDRLGKDSNLVQNQKDFDTFWQAYPKKKGKGKAEDSWNKLKPDLAVVLEAIEREKQSLQWKKDKGQFIPFPATWLNQKRWEDETEVDTNNFSKYDS